MPRFAPLIPLACSLAIVGCPGSDDDDSAPADDDDTASAPPDLDGDGSPEGVDCDDADPRNFPGNPEACDGADNDCDGLVDTADPDASCGPADALGWALGVATFSDGVGLYEDLVAVSDQIGDGVCPAVSIQKTTNPDWCFPSGSAESVCDTRVGSCTTTGGHAVTGAVQFDWESGSCSNGMEGRVDEWRDITGTSLRFEHPSGAAEGLPDTFAIDGTLDYDRHSVYGYGYGSVTMELVLDMDLEHDTPPASGALAVLVESGVTEIDLSTAWLDRLCDPFSFEREESRTSSGTAVSDAVGIPWEASWKLSWAVEALSGDEQCAVAGSCALEPLAGAVSVSLLDGPGGDVVAAASITYDGATACDGCGQVVIDGVPTTPRCGDAPIQ